MNTIPHGSFLIVCLETNNGFWCDRHSFEPITTWFAISDMMNTIKQNKSISYTAWQDFQMMRCFCSGRGD